MRLIFVFISIFSFNAFAHVQGPREVKKVVYSYNPEVFINVGNVNDETEMYYIEINGELKKNGFLLKRNEMKKIKIKLPKIEPNRINYFKVCSISGNKKVESKICTQVKVYFPQY
ncbi:hypothetical protein MYD45_000811 [Vibrio parahaemolyticus]|nr:hypothetical protein [Vibrio parahaemolyticus]EJC7038625.1 hypothetical protein [Vibrio parahaemolyticus]ELA8156585.1 hypothetical protein [Vibrio parahaemolyticus]